MTVRRSSRVSAQPATITEAAKVVPKPNTARKRTASSVDVKTSTKKAKQSQKQAPSQPESEFKVPELPITPNKRGQTRKATRKIPPLTPTPSLVNAIRAPHRAGDIDNATPPPQDRPVDPHVTNAPLVTPGGTKTLAYPTGDPDPSPSKTGLPRPIATTGTLLDKACAHLIKIDPRMKILIDQHTCGLFTPAGLVEEIDPFRALASGIMGQQISGAAAAAVEAKFVALFNKDITGRVANGEQATSTFPTPAQVAVTSIERLRLAGLSQRKAEYIQGLAEKFVNKELTNAMLMTASDDEVMEKLIAVRGLGKWSVEMFSCFGLKRLDILSTGDLGVQRGMAHFFGKDVAKLKAKGGGKWKYMSEQDMLDKSAPFAPYRSLFMWYMWKAADVDVSVLQST